MRGMATTAATENIFHAPDDGVSEHIYSHQEPWNPARIYFFDNNLFHHLNGYYTVVLDGEVKGLTEWQSEYGHDLRSLTADPLFADPKRDDYTVDASSPALLLGFENIDTTRVGLLPDFPWCSHMDDGLRAVPRHANAHDEKAACAGGGAADSPPRNPE
jgi:hypothetical protein